MSSFDPNTFLNSLVTETFQKRNLVPVRDYIGEIGEVKFRSGQQRKDPTKEWNALNIPITVDLSSDPEAMAAVGQPKVTLYDFVGLDLTPSGTLDTAPGRNSRLARYRAAIGAETGPFSPSMLQGKFVRVKVKHELDQNNEPRDAVDSVAKVG